MSQEKPPAYDRNPKSCYHNWFDGDICKRCGTDRREVDETYSKYAGKPQAELCVESPSYEEIDREASRQTAGYDEHCADPGQETYSCFVAGCRWFRANTKLRSVDEVRDEAQDIYAGQLSVRIEQLAELRAQNKVLCEALEEIASSTKFAKDTALKRSFAMLQQIAEEALKKAGDVG